MEFKFLEENPYYTVIQNYVNNELQGFAKNLPINDKLEVITNLLIGTKEVRYGSIPNPEALVVIRSVIRHALQTNTPIPILVPWGSIKRDLSSSIDVAELSSVNRLVKLLHDVKDIYEPGLDMVIRVEDTSGISLFGFDYPLEDFIINLVDYTNNFCSLVKILSEGKIRTIKESDMVNSNTFTEIMTSLIPYFTTYLMESEDLIEDIEKVENLDSYKKLKELGWSGYIVKAQREYYYDSYNNMISNNTHFQNVSRLALYLAQSLTRAKLNMSGKQDNWIVNDKHLFIQLTFVPPIKGLPEGYSNNYIYYRTLPLSQARTHITPWRAKGYLLIDGDKACAKLCSFRSDAEDIIISDMVITNNIGDSVTIRMNYIINS